MDVTYKPEDGPEQSWHFNPGRVRQVEAESIEAKAGCSWDEWTTKVQQGAARARRVLLWHLIRRDHPTLRYDDTPDFYMEELVVQFDASEIKDFIARLDDSGNVMNADEREMYRTALGNELEKAKARDEGKALSLPSAPDTA